MTFLMKVLTTVILIHYFELKVKVIVIFKIHQEMRIKTIQLLYFIMFNPAGIQFQVIIKSILTTGNSGFLVILNEDNRPIDYFKLFLTDEIIQLMVIETNRNAQQILSLQIISRGSRFLSWKPITKDDMEKCMGLLLWMGLIKIPPLANY